MVKIRFEYILVLLLLAACEKKEALVTGPVVANFEAVVTGQAPEAKITIINNSTGASQYLWSIVHENEFSSSVEQHPAPILVARSGEYTIKLQASNDENTDEKEIVLNVEEKVRADFSIRVNGKAPKAVVTLVNKSIGADSYNWIFDPALNMSNSTEAEPRDFKVEKEGNYEITLEAIKNDVTSRKTLSVFIAADILPNFEIKVTGQSPNATVELINQSYGASSYSWSFSEGANHKSSKLETPPSLTVDKAGEFTVTLEAINGTDRESISMVVVIEGISGILSFYDLKFALNSENVDYGQYFSIKTGEVYRYEQLNESLVSYISFNLGVTGDGGLFFQSPHLSNISISNAQQTNIDNSPQDLSITVDNFESMGDESLLSQLNVFHEGNVFLSVQVPNIVLFQTSNDIRGAILVKELDLEKIVVDIKVQKY